MAKEQTAHEKRLKWLLQFESGRRWLNAVAAEESGSEGTKRAYALAMREYSKFTGKTPDELMAERKEQVKSDDLTVKRRAEETLREFILKFASNHSPGTIKLRHAAIKSFYKYNYYPLMSKTPKGTSKVIPPVTIEDLRKVDAAADARERLILRFMKDTGISLDDVVDVTYGHIQRDYEAGKEFLHLNVIRKKEGIRYETFAGPNFVKALKIIDDMRKEKNKPFKPDTPLFTSVTFRKPLSKHAITAILKRLGSKVGVTLTSHRLRKFFASYMALGVKHPVVLKYWMGHAVASSDVEARYVILPTPEQEKVYREAYKHIDIEPTQLIELQKRQQIVEELHRKIYEREPLTDEDFALAKRYNIRFVTRHKRHVGKGVNESEDCANGQNCGEKYEEINEGDLLQYLSQGWQIVHKLENGKLIIRKG